MSGYVYILASQRNGTLYVGVTNNLQRRIQEHKEGVVDGFTKKYNIKHLVYYEVFENMYDAINREKQPKTWKRDWKLVLIQENNQERKDLSNDL